VTLAEVAVRFHAFERQWFADAEAHPEKTFTAADVGHAVAEVLVALETDPDFKLPDRVMMLANMFAVLGGTYPGSEVARILRQTRAVKS